MVSIGSNSVTFIDTATNAVKHTTYVGRSPHEAFFTPDGKEVWVTVRGENYVAVLDGQNFEEKPRIMVPAGPGMQIFSPDGKYGYVCSSFNPETVVITVADHQIVGRVKQDSPFCPNIAATPDGKQVWFTLKDVGKTMVFDARPPFNLLKSIDTGPITNHVNFAHNANGTFAYVTVGGLNESRCFAPTTSRRLRRSRSASCRMASGRPATAAGSMSGWKTPTAWPRSIRDQQGDRDRPGRPGAASDQLCTERRAGRRRYPGTAALGVAGQATHLTLGAAEAQRAGGRTTDAARPASRCSIRD